MMLWMFLTALIVLFGAAYNAEIREHRRPAPQATETGRPPSP